MRTERRYRWRVVDRGKLVITRAYLTEGEVMRDYPQRVPEPLLETEQVLEVPVTEAEILAAIDRIPSQYGPSSKG
jgi:hypothetical protein